MRIAHVITRMILGGAQENTLLTCEGLLKRYGDDVLLITGPALGLEGSLIERARAGGVPLEIMPALRRAIHPWHDLRSYRQLLRVLRDFRPDVVHTHSAKGGILGRAAAHRLRVPTIVHTVHGAPFHEYQNAIAREFSRRAERWAARRCHALISVADAMTARLAAAGVAPAEKFTTIRSGFAVEPLLKADAQREPLRRQLGYQPRDVVIGKIARLFPLKGHEYLLRAAPAIVAARPDARFLLIGDGRLRERLQRNVDRAGLAEHFRFFGLAQPEKIPGLLAAMDVVVHVSLREGLARVLPEAMIAGRPVISYDVDGAREVVIDHETGILLPPRSVDALSAAVIKLAKDPGLRARLGDEGRRRCTEPFRAETMVAQIRELYERLRDARR
jgi:glycosyltransferase involved in cell wall biosynthesis